MYLARVCPCCEGADHRTFPAIVSPFLAEYALGTKPERTNLLECDDCGFRWFEDRLTDGEAGRLYDGYRSERYYRVRHRHEPWYTRKAHGAVGAADPRVADARRDMVDRFLRDHVDVSRFGTVLDYGGDRGQIIPKTFGKERFVYEISNLEPIAGVGKIGSRDDLAGKSFDLVLLCHVLEHCSDPAAVLADVAPLLGSDDAVLYVEVPFERARLDWLGRPKGYLAYLDALRRVRPLLVAVDLYSTAFRTRYNVVPPLGFVKMHEHINFFDERSLAKLLARAGFDVLALEKMAIHSALGRTDVLGLAARRRVS